jgi:hypothetical protein
LADALGGNLRLPLGAVCSDCNDALNRNVDRPFQKSFSIFLNYLSIGSSKRDSAAPVRVLAETAEGGLVPVQFPRKGRAYVPPQQRLSRRRNGASWIESWNFVRREDAESYLESLRSRGATVTAVESPATITPRFQHTSDANINILGRGVAKTCFNYLILRRPDIAATPRFDAVRDLVLRGVGQWPVAIPNAIARGETVNVNHATAIHRVRIASQGDGQLAGELVLFDLLPFTILFPRAWPAGEDVELEHEFDAIRRSDRIIR